jgi:hypothetical protein
MKGQNTLCRYKRVLLPPNRVVLWLTVRKLLVPQNIRRYRQGVALTDCIITGQDCTLRGCYFHCRNVIPFSDYNY